MQRVAGMPSAVRPLAPEKRRPPVEPKVVNVAKEREDFRRLLYEDSKVRTVFCAGNERTKAAPG